MNAIVPAIRSAKHEAACKMAERGVPVFPCMPDAKEPATPHGFRDATCDLAAIDERWNEADYNVAFEPERAGLCVLDIDGAEGENTLVELELKHGFLPETYEVRTPRGGRHLYFRGSLPPTTSKLGAKIDTRGRGSYVLIPPSTVNGRPYEVVRDIEPAELPAWITDEISRRETKPVSAAKGAPVSREHLETILRFVNLTERNDWRDIVAAIRNTNVPDDEDEAKRLDLALRWSRGEYNGGVPPGHYDGDEAVEEVFWSMPPCESGVSYGTILHMARQGGFAGRSAFPVETAQEAFGPAIERLNAPQDPEHSPGVIVLRNEAVQNARKPPSWLIEGFLPDIGTAALHAPFNSFKSFTATDALMSAVSGLPCFGKLPVKRPGPAVYITGEGLSGFETLRRPAWRIGRGIPADHELPIFTVDGVPQVRSDGEVARYLEAIATLKQRPSLIVIDPVARAMVGLKENDASDAAVYLNCVERLARTFRCCVLSVLHEGKDATRDIRGSSAFAAGFDAVWKQEADTDALTATIRPVKLKDDAGVDPLCIKARQIAVPGMGKGSLVFDLVPASEVRSASKGGVQRSEISRALQALGAIAGRTISTRVLAHEIAGPDADENVIAAKEKNLRRYAKDRFRAYVAHLGEGGRDATLWTFPRTEDEERGNV